MSWTGTIPLEYNNGYLFATVTGPDGRVGTFAVDIGAANTIATEDFVPASTEITKAYMMEYSSKGARKLKYEPGGATGPVRTVKGQASLASLKIGDITLADVGVDVISSLPDLRGTPIDGIIGMNVLRAGGFLTLHYGSERSSQPSLTVSDQTHMQGKNCTTLPFSRNGELMYVRGAVADKPVYFILDSGSPSCVMPPQSLTVTGATLKSDSSVTFQGGGGQEWQGRVGTIDELSVGGRAYPEQPFLIGDIQVLQRLAKSQASGLLGNSFFSQFEGMEIDFQNEVVRFAHP
jgi:predicted aspartyl protease